ncbi:MAG: DUF4440 domain-containing protein [Hyphomicrobiales bacterium]|nr:DUF4440 domain-containing protein [Hyphomicrobiales bacterium]
MRNPASWQSEELKEANRCLSAEGSVRRGAWLGAETARAAAIAVPASQVQHPGTSRSDKIERNSEGMDMRKAAVAALFALFTSPSLAQTTAGEIEKANQQFVQAIEAGDAATIARVYTEHAVVLPPNARMIEGRDAIQKYWQGVIDAGLGDLTLNSIRVDEYGGDAAREIGWFRVKEPRDQAGPVEGKYVVVWRKIGSDWRHDSDIWNFTSRQGPSGTTGGSAAPAAVGTGDP